MRHQGYLDKRIELDSKRPALPQDEGLRQFCCDYHQGRHLTFNIAGDSPNLPPGTQLGNADRRALTRRETNHKRRRLTSG